jgi:GNAT superfamily N-acetyltransferase
MSARIEPLTAGHQRTGFDCGEVALNDFLHYRAHQQQRRGLSKTYVALASDGETVIGFVTVSAGQVAAVELPTTLKLPRYPVPVLRIGRLAVDRREQGKGLGQDLLAFALNLALSLSQRVGIYAVIVDAKHEQAATFYRQLGFETMPEHPLQLFLPLSRLAKTH